jgi:hypothetical protein
MILWQIPVVYSSQRQLPSNTENISNVGSNEKNSSDINTTDVDFLFADTDWQTLFDIDFELQNVSPANVPRNPVQSVQSMPVQFNSLMEANNRNVMPAISNITVLFISIFIHNDGCISNIFILLHFCTIVTVVFVSLLIKSFLNQIL